MEVHEVGNNVVALDLQVEKYYLRRQLKSQKTPVISVEPKTIPKPAAPAPVVPSVPKPEPKPAVATVIPQLFLLLNR
jgi:hypothetical protein